MPNRTLNRLRSNEDGVILVEIVVSAMLLVIVALGVFTAFDASTRATSEERHRARAHSIAEADVERMRGMRVADLSGLNQTRTVTQDTFTYTVRSTATFGTETGTTSTCAAGTGSRDLIQITSRVTWASIGTRPAVTVSSVVSPPNGSVVPNSGSLLVSVKDSRAVGLSGVSLSGSGPGSFSGTTGPGGCVMWKNLPQGTYTLTFAGTASGKVDPEGESPGPDSISIVAGSTNTAAYEIDSPGRIQNVAFNTFNYSNSVRAMTWDSITVGHSSMNTAEVFNSTTGRQLNLSTPQTLYPFTSAYYLFAGSCAGNNPGSGLGLGSSVVPQGGSVTGPTLRMPALQVTVWSGSSSSSPGSRVSGGEVTATDRSPSCNVSRELTPGSAVTNSSGQVPDDSSGRPMIGLPYGTDYEICARNSGGTDVRRVTGFDLTSTSGGTPLNIYIGGTSSGTCP